MNQDFHSHCTLNQISSMMKRVSGPGSRRRYNDKICGHQEKASENDQEFQSIMMELQRDVKSVQVGHIVWASREKGNISMLP